MSARQALSSAQRKPTDYTGSVFGKMTVESMVAKADGRRLWLCRCECGNAEPRTIASLRGTIGHSGVPQCEQCRIRLVKRTFDDPRGITWERHRSLYHHRATAKLCAEVRLALEDEFGDAVEPSPLPLESDISGDTRGADRRIDAGHNAGEFYSDIAAEFGVTRSRAHQMVRSSLRAFAKRWRVMFPDDSAGMLPMSSIGSRAAYAS